MAYLETYQQQPSDNLDYDIEYGEFLSDGDTVVSATKTVEPVGLTVTDPVVISDTRLKVWVTGGTSGSTYKVTVTTTTASGRVKQDELRFRIREI